MSHPEVEIVSIEIPVNDKEAMDKFQDVMNEWQDGIVDYITKVAKGLNISMECASDVWYLRTRSRWTQELEDELIRLYSIGQPPNVYDWP